eukprot:117719-Rhodomonas_salina.1
MAAVPARACVIRKWPAFPMGSPQSEPPPSPPSAHEDESEQENMTEAAQGEHSMNHDLQAAGTDLHSISAEGSIASEGVTESTTLGTEPTPVDDEASNDVRFHCLRERMRRQQLEERMYSQQPTDAMTKAAPAETINTILQSCGSTMGLMGSCL